VGEGEADGVPEDGKSVNFGIFRVFCGSGENAKCVGLQFYTQFNDKVDQKWINSWLAKYAIGKVYINSDGKFAFDMSVHFVGGTAPEYVGGSAMVFREMLKTLWTFKPQN
jgi:hypothetical protein